MATDPFSPIREGLRDLSGAFTQRKKFKLEEEKLDLEAAERQRKLEKAQSEAQALDDYAQAIRGSKGVFIDPELAHKAALAGKPVKGYIAKKGRGGGGSGSSLDNFLNRTGRRGDVRESDQPDVRADADARDEFGMPKIKFGGGKQFDLDTVKKLKVKTLQDIASLTTATPKDAKEARALSAFQVATMRKLKGYEEMEDYENRYADQLSKVKKQVSDAEFQDAMEQTRQFFESNLAGILKEDGYPDEWINDARMHFTTNVMTNLPFGSDEILKSAPFKSQDILKEVNKNERNHAEFIELINVADAKTLDNLMKDPELGEYRRRLTLKARMGRELYDNVEAATGVAASLFGDVVDIRQDKITGMFKRGLEETPDLQMTSRKIRERLKKPILPEVEE